MHMTSKLRHKFVVILCVLTGPAAFWIAAQAPTHVVIMHTNDIHGQLLPSNGVGGIAEIASIVRQVKPDLLFDAGDFSTGTFLSDEFMAAPTIQAMNRIGYTSGTIGNHEFDYGQAALRMRLREASFPLLSANLETPIQEIKKYTVVAAKGIRFGIIGLTTEELKTKSHPEKVKGVTVLDTVKTLEKFLPELRRSSDFIIATVHLEEAEERRLVTAFPEIRLFIGGHSHEQLGPVWLDQTLVVKTGSNGRNVGRVDLEFVAKNVTNMEARLIPVKNVPPDPDVVRLLRPFETRVMAKMAEVVGEATDDIRYSPTEESPLANLVADAFREKGKTEIAIHNGGGIRATIFKGSITRGRLFEVLPFQNYLVILKLSGAQLRKTLLTGLNSSTNLMECSILAGDGQDRCFTMAKTTSIGLLAVSGLRVRFDRTKAAEKRIASLTLADGTPIDDMKLYSVTTNDYAVAGGDGFAELGKGVDILNTGIVLRDVLLDYLKNGHRRLTPKVDGRISFN
jgi:2',3'-cyclic-nucleotide 2'-phosphodiesterase (5'-nucleotidase family)